MKQRQEKPVDDWRRALSRAVLALMVAGILLGLAEIACRAAVLPERLDTILNLLERDPLLLWRLRANIDLDFENARVRTNEHHMRGPAFATERVPGRLRIVCLGPSPTFGWGVDEENTYPAVTERLLGRHGLPVEVINAGVPGYTSWQGLNFLRRDVVQWKPDLISVAYDLNDMDIFRFFRNDGKPDALQKPDNRLTVGMQNLLNRSFAYRLFRDRLIGSLVQSGAFDPTQMPRRVSFDDYRANLIAIEQICREHDIQVVFCKMPVNLPFHRLQASDPEQAKHERMRGDQEKASGNWTTALAHYQVSYRLDSTAPAIYAALAEALVRNGYKEQAEDIWRMLPFAAAFRDRADKRYNQIVEEVAGQTGRPWLDVVNAFITDGRGMGLWNSEADPFHPNAAGHAIIGEMLAAIVGPLLPKKEN